MSEEEVQAMIDAVGVEAVDDYTVKFTLAEPCPLLPRALPACGLLPMPQEVIEEHGDRWVEPGFIWTNGPMVLSSGPTMTACR